MRIVFSFFNLILKVSLSVIMRRNLSVWLYITLCPQVSGYRAAESFSRPRGKTTNLGPLRAERAENFSIAPFRLA